LVGCEDERECKLMRYDCLIGVWLRRRWQEWKRRMGWRFAATAETKMAGGLEWVYGGSDGVWWNGGQGGAGVGRAGWGCSGDGRRRAAGGGCGDKNKTTSCTERNRLSVESMAGRRQLLRKIEYMRRGGVVFGSRCNPGTPSLKDLPMWPACAGCCLAQHSKIALVHGPELLSPAPLRSHGGEGKEHPKQCG
jgi:hypothetical protein